MSNLLLLVVGVALTWAAALAMPVSAAPASMRAATGGHSAVEQAAVTCTHGRVCHQGAGCAWRKACKRW
jgi:hypothetical protein